MRLRIGLIALFLLMIPIISLPETMVEVPLSRLKELREQMDRDEELIAKLEKEVIALTNEVLLLRAEVDRINGFWVGTGISYPLGWNAQASYRFRKWGPYLMFSVGKDNLIGGGIQIKVGK